MDTKFNLNGGLLETKMIFDYSKYDRTIRPYLKTNTYSLPNTIDTENYQEIYEQIINEIIKFLDYTYIDCCYKLYYKKADLYYLLYVSVPVSVPVAESYKMLVVDAKYHITQIEESQIDSTKIIDKNIVKVNLLKDTCPMYLKFIYLFKIDLQKYFSNIAKLYKIIDNPKNPEKIPKLHLKICELKSGSNKNDLEILVDELFKFIPNGTAISCGTKSTILDIFIKTGNIDYIFNENIFGTNNDQNIEFTNMNFYESVNNYINNFNEKPKLREITTPKVISNIKFWIQNMIIKLKNFLNLPEQAQLK